MIMRLNSLYVKILAGTIGTIVVMGSALAAFILITVHHKLEDALKKRGEFMAQHIASQSATPILTERFFELDMLLKDLKAADKEIEYCFVVSSRGHVVAHTFGVEFPTDLKAPGAALNVHVFRTELLDTEKGAILDFAAPIMQGRIGTVHLGMSERPIEQAVSAMVRQLMLIIMIVLLLGSAAAIIFARAMTKPLQDLVRAAGAVGSGDLDHQITVRTRDEIGILADSFRAMVLKRKQAEQGRETLISELQEALDNVKKLEGMLPICSSCKRIRDDKGNWNQLEEYIHEHSEAEFSHGLCTDCARKIYPKYFPKEGDPQHDSST